METSWSHRKEEIRARIKAGESVGSIARSFGVSKETIRYHRRIWGDPPLTDRFWKWRSNEKSKALMESRINSNEPEKFIDKQGYVIIRANREGACGLYHREHVVIIEKKIGRRIVKGKEVVHHVNGIKSENDDLNLFFCTLSKHRKLHMQLETMAMELVRSGKIVFDGDNYKWAIDHQ